MENKKGLSITTIISLSISGAIIIGGLLPRKASGDCKEPGLFEPGEHIVSVPVEDITKQTIVYEGHAGYRPVGININSLSADSADSGNMLFVNTIEVQATSTGIDEHGNKIYEDFGTPINYTYDSNENEYDVGQHIITVPCYCDDRLNFESYDGYNIAGIVRTRISEGNEKDGCILYVNDEPVEYVYNEDNNKYFGTPIEKGKVLEK